MEPVKPGSRLRCEGCGTEVVVIKADGVLPACCGKPLASPAKS
jgi:hypothetical protein